MMQNLGLKPKINCKIITKEVMIKGFLYLIKFHFEIIYILSIPRIHESF